MSRFLPSRLLAQNALQTASKPRFVAPSVPRWTRLFSQSPARPNLPERPTMEQLARTVATNSSEGGNNAGIKSDIGSTLQVDLDIEDEPHHFHIFSMRHNTHVTVTKPNRDAIISISSGNLGFKNSARGTYDAAYQVGAYVIDKLHQMGEVKNIHKLEVVLRGFGQGREAVVKVLLGNEGKALRDKIIRVADSTRLKIGGTRSKNPRRL